MKRFLLILACVSVLCCLFAATVNADGVDPNAEYYDKVYTDTNGNEFPIYEKEGDTYYPLVWFAYEDEAGVTQYIKARFDDIGIYSMVPSQGRFNGCFYTHVDENGNEIELNTKNLLVLNLRAGVMKTTYNSAKTQNGTNVVVSTIETNRTDVFPGFSRIEAVYIPLSQTTVGSLNLGTLRVCDIDKNHPTPIGFASKCLQGSKIEEIFIPANSTFGNRSSSQNSYFQNCSKLKKVEFGGKLGGDNGEWLSGYFFSGCSSLEEIIIPVGDFLAPSSDGVYVNANAFSGCSSLKRIYFMGSSSKIEQIIKYTSSSGNSNLTNMTRISYTAYSQLADKSGGKYIIYDCSPCLAYNGDVHTPTEETVLVGDDYFGNIEVACPCGVDGCVATMTVSTIAPMFVDKGYSARTFGEGYAVTQSYLLNRAAIAEYEQYKGVKFGVVASVNAGGEAVAPVLGGDGVYSAELWDIKTNDYLDIIVNNIPDNSADVENGLAEVKNSDKNIIFCLYATDGESVVFLDGGETKDALAGISYQEILNRTEK